jgi:hypothetical protein
LRRNETTTKLSFTGSNAANFFQAEMVGVILPVLNVFLKNPGGATMPWDSPRPWLASAHLS